MSNIQRTSPTNTASLFNQHPPLPSHSKNEQIKRYQSKNEKDFEEEVENERFDVSFGQEKQSAESSMLSDLEDEGENEILSKLQMSLDNQMRFMKIIGRHLQTTIQEQILSHISKRRRKFQKIKFSMVQEYTKQRIQKMEKIRRKKKNWGIKDLQILVWTVAKYCAWKNIKEPYYGLNEDNWNEISSIIPGTSSSQCMFKWLSLKKTKVRDQKWQKSEEQLLDSLVSKYEEKGWNFIAKKLFFENKNSHKVYRCGKQCREHWNCFLNPNIKKGNWSKEQDKKLLTMILEEKGQRKWSKFVANFNGRTENSLKNRYSMIIEKERKQSKLSKKKENNLLCLKNYLKKNFNEETLLKDQGQEYFPQSLQEQIEQPQKQSSEEMQGQTMSREIKFPDVIEVVEVDELVAEELMEKFSQIENKIQLLSQNNLPFKTKNQ